MEQACLFELYYFEQLKVELGTVDKWSRYRWGDVYTEDVKVILPMNAS